MAMHKSAEKILSWLKLARLQFYPMTWLAYSLGAVAQWRASGRFSFASYLLGYLLLFLIELATIITNEYYDYDTDRQNKNFSIYTGGTRVLVTGKLSFGQLKAAIFTLLAFIPFCAYLFMFNMEGGSILNVFTLLALGVFLGLGYTAPPLKLSYRGFGEITVGVTHTIYVVLCGFIFEGGRWYDASPWLLSIPLFWAVLAANTLAGLPDWEADKAVSKRSLAVIFGPATALVMAMFFCGLALLSWLIMGYFRLIPISSNYWIIPVFIHSSLLLFFLGRRLAAKRITGMMNDVLGLSLSYIVWFGLLPLLAIW
jgi:1,4-dihydroxy-2-naphthoate polyprenyltransferase